MIISKTFMFPFNQESQGARVLSETLGIKRILRQGSKFVGSKDKTVINWGSSEVTDEIKKCAVINPPGLIVRLINKCTFFEDQRERKGARVPPFTVDTNEALRWAKKSLVVARTKLTARSGSDIVFFDPRNLDNWIKAPLYTLYIKKKSEWRVHIVGGEVICVQQKVLRKHDDAGNEINPKSVDFRIRNLKNGFIFQRNGINPPQDVIEQAVKAFGVYGTGLTFAAVDVIYNDSEKQAYVLEMNTAPGLEGTTIEDYANALRKVL